ncbi:TPA: thioredoxin [Streptococcus pyogenes]|nr:thioredoxin [Streptococcus pyogenes]
MKRFIVVFFVTFASVLILALAGLGLDRIYQEYLSTHYDTHLTQKVYSDVTEDKNVNLVFYKLGCPYCKAGREAVVSKAKTSSYTTFYIDMDTVEGQKLVKKYQIDLAATIVKIRNGNHKNFIYAIKNKDGEIQANSLAIQEAFHD